MEIKASVESYNPSFNDLRVYLTKTQKSRNQDYTPRPKKPKKRESRFKPKEFNSYKSRIKLIL